MIKTGNVNIGEGLPKICVPITATEMAGLEQEVRKATTSDCDMLEWRTDYVKEVCETARDAVACAELIMEGMVKIRSATDKPVILTVRTTAEGGRADLIRRDYYTLIRELIEKFSDEASPGQSILIDIEAIDSENEGGADRIEFLSDMARENGLVVILSNHDFDKTPPTEEIVKRICIMDKLGADIPKVAYMPNSEEDVHKVIEGARVAAEYCGKPFIAISMGDLGLPSRICSGRGGSAITFAIAGEASAPGQLPAEEMRRAIKEFYNFEENEHNPN